MAEPRHPRASRLALDDTPWTLGSRPASRRRGARGVLAVAACAASLLTATIAVAEPVNPDDAHIAQAQQEVDQHTGDVARLIADVAEADSQIQQLELEIGGLREAVNKTLVDLHDAQADAEAARQNAQAAREELDNTQEQMLTAQEHLDEIARSTYRRGALVPAVEGTAGKVGTDDSLDRATFMRLQTEQQRAALAELDRVRTEKANNESTLREARNQAEEREQQAEEAKAHAEKAIEENSARIASATAHREELVASRTQAQEKLDQAKGQVDQLNQQRAEYERYQEAQKAQAQAAAAAEAAAQEQKAAQEQAERAAAAERQAQEKAAQSRAENPTSREDAQAKAREAAEQAARAQQEAEQKQQDAQQAAAARQAAAEAASLAATALIAAAQPNHAETQSPYPRDENAAAGPVAARQVPATAAEESTAAAASPTTAAQPSTGAAATTANAEEAAASESTSAAQSGQEAAKQDAETIDLLGILDQTNAKAEAVSKVATTAIPGSREEKIEMVISRAMSQVGTPYAWGGGDANGPTKGIRDGGVADSYGDFNKIGFDCSGLTLYAFAGAGIALPHYTGYQYQRGTKVDPKNMQRGDLIFYGPNAENHVAIYLGDGTMIEAPQSGSDVHISPVRWNGMSPSVIRLI